MNTALRHIIILVAVLPALAAGQDSTAVQESTFGQDVALYTMTGIIVPMALAGTVVSVLPPSVGTVVRNGTAYGALSVETGYGDGAVRETGEFTDYRVSLTYTHVFHSKVRDLFRLEYKRDFHFDFADRRKIFLGGFHVSGGVMTDLPNHGYTVGAGAWFKSPWLPFFGFFPSHTYGITYRYNRYFAGTAFHELSLGVTSAFTF